MCKTGVIGVVVVRIIKQQFGILSTGLRSRPLNLSWAMWGGGGGGLRPTTGSTI